VRVVYRSLDPYARLYEHHIQVIEQVLTPVLEQLITHAGSSALARRNLERIAADLRGMIDRNRGADEVTLRGDEPQS
jgi:hypothetical protein